MDFYDGFKTSIRGNIPSSEGSPRPLSKRTRKQIRDNLGKDATRTALAALSTGKLSGVLNGISCRPRAPSLITQGISGSCCGDSIKLRMEIERRVITPTTKAVGISPDFSLIESKIKTQQNPLP